MTKKLKRDFSAPILELSGKPRKTGWTMENFASLLDSIVAENVSDDQQAAVRKKIELKLGETLTLGAAAATALTELAAHEPPLPSGQAGKQYALAVKIFGKGVVEIEPVERDLIKERIGKFYARTALIAGRAEDLLETEPTVEPKPE